MTEHNTIETARDVETGDMITLIFENTAGEREVVVGEATYAYVLSRNGGIDVGDYALLYSSGDARVEKWNGDEFVQVTEEGADITLVVSEKASERFDTVEVTA